MAAFGSYLVVLLTTTVLAFNTTIHLENEKHFIEIGKPCRRDAPNICANYSMCLPQVLANGAIKNHICSCNETTMRVENKTCIVRPGFQCYFPNPVLRGNISLDRIPLRHYPCAPESKCRTGVTLNNSADMDKGYCMCDVDTGLRNVVTSYELYRCNANMYTTFSALLFFCSLLCRFC